MKVLVISDYRNEHSTRPEASIFIGLARQGVDVRVMTYKEGPMVRQLEEAGVKIIDFHPNKKFDKKEEKVIRDYLIQEQIDILHLFNNKSIMNGIRAAKGLPVRVVLYRAYEGNLDWYDPTAYLKHLNSRVDYIQCNAKGVETYMRRQLLWNKDKAITVNKGHNVDWYSGYKPVDIRSKLGLNQDAFLLINVANNRKMKGIPYLLKAFNLLPAEWDIHLLIAGQGMEINENISLVKKGNNQHRVHFLGFQQDVLNIVAACDVFVLSSLFGESITKSVVEAMSLNVTPVITDIPGNQELVENEVSGLVVPKKDSAAMANAIKRLYTDRNLLKKLSVGAKQHIRQNLNEQRTVDEMHAFYKSIMG